MTTARKQLFVALTTIVATTLAVVAPAVAPERAAAAVYSANEPGGFQCRIDAGPFTACSSPYTTAALTDGPHTFQVRARDRATNVDPTPASRTFTVDATPPQTTITKGPKRKTAKKKVGFEFAADEHGASFECSLDGKPFKPCSSPLKVKAKKKGKHRMRVRATDEAGNQGDPAVRKWKRKPKR